MHFDSPPNSKEFNMFTMANPNCCLSARYYAVVKPLSSLSHFTTSKLKIIIPGCWILGFLWNTPLFLTVTYRSDLQTCGEKWPNTILPKIYSFGWNIVAGVIPVTVMTWFYFRVVRELWFKKTPAMQCNSTVCFFSLSQLKLPDA